MWWEIWRKGGREVGSENKWANLVMREEMSGGGSGVLDGETSDGLAVSWNRAETLLVWRQRRTCWAEMELGWGGTSAVRVIGWPR